MELRMYELAEQLKQLREEKKDAEQRVKDINAEIDNTEYALVQLMAETETQNFTRAGTMFSLTTKTRASAMAGRKDKLYSALKENGFGELVYETVNANSLPVCFCQGADRRKSGQCSRLAERTCKRL